MKEIIDIYIENGYPYNFDLDFNLFDGSDLESEYTCYFYCEDIGTKEYTVSNNIFKLTLSEADTSGLENNLQEYVVYAVNTQSQSKEKLLTGRIVIDKKIRG